MAYDTIGFTLHRACNASCNMCCFSSNPSCTEVLSTTRIKEYIDQAKEIPDIKSIAFTGGEPFLYFDKLNELVAYASDAGKKTSTVTNCFWAKDNTTAFQKLRLLKESGLDHLSISHDLFHRQYVPTQMAKNVMRVAAKLEIPLSLALVITKGQKIGEIIDTFGSDIYTASVKIGPCLPVGAAALNYSSDSFDATVDTCDAKCTYGGNITVLYDGTIYPCCSQVVIETGLGLGNFYDISLSEALRRAKNNSLLYLLRNKPMSIFADYANQNLGINLPKQIINPCDLCRRLFNPEVINKYQDFARSTIDSIRNPPRQKEQSDEI